MRLVEQHIIRKGDPRYARIDEAAFASKNLWNLANYYVGTLIIGKNAFWKQEVEMGKRNNQAFVQIPHARFIEMLQYKAALVGITVIITEESYTSLASFLDRNALPTYDPKRTEEPRFSGRRKGRWYYASGKRVIHSEVNGSYNIGRKVVPTAFDGPEIEAPQFGLCVVDWKYCTMIYIICNVKHPCRATGWACEAIRLVTGEPTRATVRLAYPSSRKRASEGD